MDDNLNYIFENPYGCNYFYRLDTVDTKNNTIPQKKRIDNIYKDMTTLPQVWFINRIDNVDRSFNLKEFVTVNDIKDLNKIDYLLKED